MSNSTQEVRSHLTGWESDGEVWGGSVGLLGHNRHDRGLALPHANEQQFSLNSPSWPGSEETWQPQNMLPADTSSASPVPTTILQRRPKSGEYM